MEELIRQLARQIQNKYYGKYRGFVVDNADPQCLGRLRLRVPTVLGEAESAWALPCMPFGGLPDQGQFTIPEVGAQVWVEFEEGELSHPIWSGTFWQPGDVPAEADRTEPTTRLIKTPAGHRLQFDDEDGAERLTLHHPRDAELTIDEHGTVNLTDAQGARLTLDAQANEVVLQDAHGNTLTLNAGGTTVEDAHGNKIEMAAGSIRVQGTQITIEGTQVNLGGVGGEPLIKGMSFLTLFATHIHPTGAGPSGPPVPQGEFGTLSTTVKTT